MRLYLHFAVLVAACCWQAAGQQSEFAAGRQYYSDGEYQKAAAHFELAAKADPRDAAAYYWAGRSQEMQAAIATPFGGKCAAKARINLAKAVELAPERPQYRQELFDFLLDSAWLSPSSLRQAAAMLRATSEDDPDYVEMRRRLEEERHASSSVASRLAQLLLAGPRTAFGAVSAIR
jgi:tetratricopeptide (TPR) repeat protein